LDYRCGQARAGDPEELRVDKLIITVTVDSTMSYPGNPNCPPTENVKAVADEYIRAVNAGASITHIHGVHTLEHEIQADGRRLSKTNFEGWKDLNDRIRAGCDPIMQFGIASARFEEKVHLMTLHPEMMAIAFVAHDEYFRPDPAYPANEMYAVHPRDELVGYCKAALEHGVKVEVESFHTGGFWNLEFCAKQGLLPEPIYTTLFLGWAGGCWTPPTPKALIYMVDHLPAQRKINWNVSVMDPKTQWQILSLAINLGGHVRVGWEDNPYLDDQGTLATTNAQLVEKIVRIARELGREVASPEEARQILGVPQPVQAPAGK
jgi:3-keto-5-aminohexanoate cleavage enzyme